MTLRCDFVLQMFQSYRIGVRPSLALASRSRSGLTSSGNLKATATAGFRSCLVMLSSPSGLNQCIFCSFRALFRPPRSKIPKVAQLRCFSKTPVDGRKTGLNEISFRPAQELLKSPSARYSRRKGDVASSRRSAREDARAIRLAKEEGFETWSNRQGNEPIDADGLRKSVRKDARILRAVGRISEVLTIDSSIQALGLDFKSFRRQAREFRRYVEDCFVGDEHDPQLLDRLRTLKAFDGRDSSLDAQVRYEFYDWCVRATTPSPPQPMQSTVRIYPFETFGQARRHKRQIHLHIGPTNSGKTYHALKRLEQAKSGVYCGPLRLLAHEVYMRLLAKGIKCDLVTGDEIRQDLVNGRAPIQSCTVEMCPLEPLRDPIAEFGRAFYEVAVIDEIQMLGSSDRGWAWTAAFMGLCANEVHVCGEERAEPLVRALTAGCGDELTVHRYERLSPLELSPKHLGSLRNLKKGDCVVSFSVVALHSLRQEIEKMTGKRCAIIYGSLPPETRAQQAKLFNDPNNNYDYLVASNAIGMGLNLEIKRMVFHSTQRRIGNTYDSLTVPELKQIAGRAGRYSTAARDMQGKPVSGNPIKPVKTESVGLVTTLEKEDFSVLEDAMSSTVAPMLFAGYIATDKQLCEYIYKFPPHTPLSYILLKMYYSASLGEMFFPCEVSKLVTIADVLEPVKELRLYDRIVFLAAPMEPRREKEPELARRFATAVASGQPLSPLDIEELELGLLDDQYNISQEYLKRLEALHKAIIIHNWLAYRFPLIFTSIDLGLHIRELVEHRIEKVLFELSFDYETVERMSRLRARRMRAEQRREQLDAQQKANSGDGISIQSLLANHDASFLPKQRLKSP